MENVPQITMYEKMRYWTPFASTAGTEKKEKPVLDRKSRGRFSRLAQMVYDTHQSLKQKGSLLSLYLRGDDSDPFMDVVVMDKLNTVSQRFTRSIKHTKLKPLIKNIHNQIGLVFDYRV